MRFEESIRDINPDKSWLVLGRVVGSVADKDVWRKVFVVCDDNSGVVECRPLVPGAGGVGVGQNLSFQVGQEVLVLFPSGDRNNGLVLLGPTNRFQSPADVPEDTGGSTDPNGSEYRKPESTGLRAVATEDTTKALRDAITHIKDYADDLAAVKLAYGQALVALGVHPNPITESLRQLLIADAAAERNRAIALSILLGPLQSLIANAINLRGGQPYYTSDLRVGVRFNPNGTPIPPPPAPTPGNGKPPDSPPSVGVVVKNLVVLKKSKLASPLASVELFATDTLITLAVDPDAEFISIWSRYDDEIKFALVFDKDRRVIGTIDNGVYRKAGQ